MRVRIGDISPYFDVDGCRLMGNRVDANARVS
jgi:hypothetical protein